MNLKQENKQSYMKIGLVLSGGGVRGIAHLGVLKSLQERGIEISMISGCSAGSIVGAMFGAGYSPEHILEIVVSTTTLRAMRPAFSRLALLKLDKIENAYLKYIPHNSFEKLKIPLIVNATDIENGENIFFDEGELLKPVLASCCVPGLFEPIKFQEKTFVDGGVLNNMPVEPLEGKCDFILGSHCNPIGKLAHNSMPSILQKSLFLAINNNSRHRLNKCNYVIEPPALSRIDPFNVRKAQEIFKIGYEFTQQIDMQKIINSF